MKQIRKSSEAEMIYEFLKGEYRSERFSEELAEAMERLGYKEELILSANLLDAEENEKRKKLLGAFRGYGEDRELFEHFPEVTEWSLCSFGQEDLKNIRYIDYSYWNELSAGTGSPLEAAKTIRQGTMIYEVSNDGFLKAAEYIKNGGTFPKLFFLTSDYEHFVIVEGHQRMTAYGLLPEYFQNVEVIVGKSTEEEIKNWM